MFKVTPFPSVPAIGPQNRHRTLRTAHRGRSSSNIFVVNCRPWQGGHQFGLNISLTNTQSLAPKIDEVRSVMLDAKPDLGFFTETWLRDTISDSQVSIPGYSFIVLWIFMEEWEFTFMIPSDLSHSMNFRIPWVWLRPRTLPRGFSYLVAGTIYHPQLGMNDSGMLNHLTSTLNAIVGQYPGCGTFVCDVLNRMNLSRLTSQFKFRQIVDKPTRGDKILDPGFR